MSVAMADTVNYDLETQKSADEVGGWHKANKMRVSVGYTYNIYDGYKVWWEEDIVELINYLLKFKCIISYNGIWFDSKVLSKYGVSKKIDKINAKSYDLCVIFQKAYGKRSKLDQIAIATLGKEFAKSAGGMKALEWWYKIKKSKNKARKLKLMNRLTKYCRMDVKITHDLVVYAIAYGFLLVEAKKGGIDIVDMKKYLP